MPTPEELSKHVEKAFPVWLEGQTFMLDLSREDLQAFLDAPSDDARSIGSTQMPIAYALLKRFVLEAARPMPDDLSQITQSTRLYLAELRYAIGVQQKHPKSGIGVNLHKAVTSMMMAATLGWQDQTELQARLIFQELAKHSLDRGKRKGGAVFQGQTFYAFPYAIMDIMKDFLAEPGLSTQTPWRKDVYEDRGGHLGWQELADGGWKTPDVFDFEEVLNRAAAYHLDQSKERETVGKKHDRDGVKTLYPEVDDDAFWLYPVILYTVLRLREWHGLDNPATLRHPLFAKAVFDALPPTPENPSDPFFDSVDTKFREVFADTPGLDDLPSLRGTH